MAISTQTLQNNLVFDIESEKPDYEYLKDHHSLFTPEVIKQLIIDFDTLTDQELADKYPDITREWIPDESISLYKKKLVYLLEQSIVYFDVGGYSPDGILPPVKSDLRHHHLPNTVESTILTLRRDIIPSSNQPKNDLDSTDPHIWAWENDDEEWKKINIRRVHHMFDMQLRKWHPNQLWLVEKLSRWTATIKYYEHIKDAERHHPLYTADPLEIRTKTTTVTLDPNLMPHIPEQQLVSEEPLALRWDLYNDVTFWDINNQAWITIKSFQILDMEVLEDKTPPPPLDPDKDGPLKPKNKKPSNWRRLRDGLDKVPVYD
jgi:hypothetical protein